MLVKPPRKTQPLTKNKVTCVLQGADVSREGVGGRRQARTSNISEGYQNVLLINDFFTVHTIIGLQPFLFIYP